VLAAGGGSVSLTAAGPQPAAITVETGQTVTWTNGDSVTHTLASRSAGIVQTPLAPGARYERAFAAPGVFAYRDTAAQSLRGSVIVILPPIRGPLTLVARPATVWYGQRVVLAGRSPLASQAVTLEQHVRGVRGWRPVPSLPGALVASATGAFAVAALVPHVNTSYRASAGGGRVVSREVAVSVRPRLALVSSARRAATGSMVRLRARLVPARAAARVALLRRSARRGGWVRHEIRAVRRGVAVFRWRVRPGRTLLRAEPVDGKQARSYRFVPSVALAVAGVGGEQDRRRRRR
jgi:hypothetical protein